MLDFHLSLFVLVPPSFISVPSDQTVLEKDQVALFCSASGNPVANITWLKDGRTVGVGNDLRFEVTRDESGKYWCLADNGIETKIETTFLLDVQCKCSIKDPPALQ